MFRKQEKRTYDLDFLSGDGGRSMSIFSVGGDDMAVQVPTERRKSFSNEGRGQGSLSRSSVTRASHCIVTINYASRSVNSLSWQLPCCTCLNVASFVTL